MSVSDLLDITCNLYKKTKTTDDVGGIVETQVLRVSDIPCRIVHKTSQDRIVLGREGSVATHTVYIALDG